MEPADPVVVQRLSVEARPSWSDVTSAGVFRVEPGGRFDRHFHDCDEYWLLFHGRARVVVGAGSHEVGPGDIVCTPTGTVHDVVGVYEALEGFWFEGATPEGGRVGHLHETASDAEGHEVEVLEGESMP
ncbi:MAG TPA: cupin domain-containing protein [Actinomycetota bacterium]|nr:cupin domain-containing protein [Actinomycetota bacterium]